MNETLYIVGQIALTLVVVLLLSGTGVYLVQLWFASQSIFDMEEKLDKIAKDIKEIKKGKSE